MFSSDSTTAAADALLRRPLATCDVSRRAEHDANNKQFVNVFTAAQVHNRQGSIQPLGFTGFFHIPGFSPYTAHPTVPPPQPFYGPFSNSVKAAKIKQNSYNKCSAVAEMGDHLATIDMGRKLGALSLFGEGSWVTNLTQCHLGRGLSPYQVSS